MDALASAIESAAEHKDALADDALPTGEGLPVMAATAHGELDVASAARVLVLHRTLLRARAGRRRRGALPVALAQSIGSSCRSSRTRRRFPNGAPVKAEGAKLLKSLVVETKKHKAAAGKISPAVRGRNAEQGTFYEEHKRVARPARVVAPEEAEPSRAVTSRPRPLTKPRPQSESGCGEFHSRPRRIHQLPRRAPKRSTRAHARPRESHERPNGKSRASVRQKTAGFVLLPLPRSKEGRRPLFARVSCSARGVGSARGNPSHESEDLPPRRRGATPWSRPRAGVARRAARRRDGCRADIVRRARPSTMLSTVGRGPKNPIGKISVTCTPKPNVGACLR